MSEKRKDEMNAKANRIALGNQIIKVCAESGLGYGEVMKTLKNVEWDLLTKAETFLHNAEIKKVSECESDFHIELMHAIKDVHIQKQNEDF